MTNPELIEECKRVVAKQESGEELSDTEAALLILLKPERPDPPTTTLLASMGDGLTPLEREIREGTATFGGPETVASKSGAPRQGHDDEDKPAVGPLKDNGQHGDYWVLSKEERDKGFCRPVRTTYKHVGVRPQYPTRELTDEELKLWDDMGYVCFEPYPEEYRGSSTGRFWTKRQIESGCGAVTRMSMSISETYARNPSFYGSTFCVGCNAHHPVGEFVWDGTDDRVGS